MISKFLKSASFLVYSSCHVLLWLSLEFHVGKWDTAPLSVLLMYFDIFMTTNIAGQWPNQHNFLLYGCRKTKKKKADAAQTSIHPFSVINSFVIFHGLKGQLMTKKKKGGFGKNQKD